MNPMKWIPLLLAAALVGCSPNADAPEPAADTPEPAVTISGPAITDAWVRQVPPTARMTAGYFRIHNPGPAPLVITGVESPLFGLIELHGTFTEDGVARMRQQETVTVPPGESVSFEPGGLHLMLMQPVNGIPSSGTLELTLQFDDGTELEFDAPVSPPRN